MVRAKRPPPPRVEIEPGDRPTAPTVAAVVREQTGAAWSRARSLCTDGRVTLDGQRCLDPAARVPPGALVVVDEQGPKLRTGPLSAITIVYHDRDLVVVDKPAGMLSVADEEGNRDTLLDYARTLLRRLGGPGDDGRLGVVHRIDRDTSGLMVYARTAEAKRSLAAQFRAHEIERVYHAIAHGTVHAGRAESDLILDRGDGLRGSFGYYQRTTDQPPPEARHAVTHFAPLKTLDGATLVECRLETGRQHQIRIHLYETGHPLVGERVYIRGYAGFIIDAPRPMLHAQALGFTHPRHGEQLRFERAPPADFQALLDALRLDDG